MRQLTLPSLYSRRRQPADASGSIVRTARQTLPGRRRVPSNRYWANSIKRRLPRFLDRLLRPRMAIPAAATALALLLGGLAVDHAGSFAAVGQVAKTRLIAWSGSLGVAVSEVLVKGRQETPTADVLAALNVRYGTPLFAFSPEDARARLLKIGWVADARVERRLPGTVFVELEERRPEAIWQYRGEFALVDAGGAVIGREDVGRYPDLRLVVGPDAPAHFAELFEILEAEPGLAPQVVAAVRVGRRRWNLQFERGPTVLLPESGIAEAWALLARLAREAALLDRDITRIDLRSPDRMIVRLSPDAARSRADQGA